MEQRLGRAEPLCVTQHEQFRTLGVEGDDKPDKKESAKKGPLRSRGLAHAIMKGNGP